MSRGMCEIWRCVWLCIKILARNIRHQTSKGTDFLWETWLNESNPFHFCQSCDCKLFWSMVHYLENACMSQIETKYFSSRADEKNQKADRTWANRKNYRGISWSPKKKIGSARQIRSLETSWCSDFVWWKETI